MVATWVPEAMKFRKQKRSLHWQTSQQLSDARGSTLFCVRHSWAILSKSGKSEGWGNPGVKPDARIGLGH